MNKMINRREFVKNVGVISTGIVLGTSAISAKSYSRILGSNERINFAVVGLHGRGNAHLEAIKNCDNAVVSHICDVDVRELTRFSSESETKFGVKPIIAKDYRELVESKDFDAVTIATPEHWHAHMAIMAVQNNKHVYLEKPCSHNPAEGELIVEAQKKYGKLIQMGNQQRSSKHTIEIIQKIKDGIIGNAYYGKAWYSNSRTSIGVGKEIEVPNYLDWELWQGPAPRKAYKDNIHPYNWHWFWHWGTGETLNNGTHEVDLCRWALNVDFPNSITASGGRYNYKDDWEFYDTLITDFEYDDKMISWEGRSCNNNKLYNRGRGAAIYGDKGTVIIDRNGYEIMDLDNSLIEEYKTEEKNTTKDLLSLDSMTDSHFQNLVDGIRNGEKLKSPINEGYISVAILQLSNIAWKTNSKLFLNNANGHIINNSEAEKLWSRDYEPGWEIKV